MQDYLVPTSRLTFRFLQRDDEQDLFALYGDENFMRFSGAKPWTHLQEAEAFLTKAFSQRADGLGVRVAVLKAGAFVGVASLMNVDHVHRRAEIGYGLKAEAWGRGYASEIVAWLTRLAFGRMALNRLEANVDPRNAASVRVLEKMGFQHEGTLRERIQASSGPCDSAVYGLLRSEMLL